MKTKNHVTAVLFGSTRGCNEEAICEWIESPDCSRLVAETIAATANRRIGNASNDPLMHKILETMQDFTREHLDDIFWVGPCETLFERLYGLYVDFGGDLNVLHEKFPELK